MHTSNAIMSLRTSSASVARCKVQNPLKASPVRHARIRATKHQVVSANLSEARATVRKCALKRGADKLEVVEALELIEKNSTPIDPAVVNGKWELVFSSAINNVPLMNGYMPVREIITIDKAGESDGGFIRLDTDVLWFTMSMFPGTVFEWEAAENKLSFNLRKKEDAEPSPVKSWSFFLAEDGVMAARSSGTGLNVLKRVA